MDSDLQIHQVKTMAKGDQQSSERFSGQRGMLTRSGQKNILMNGGS